MSAPRPTTADPAYDAAMNALHDATTDSTAWDVAWAPAAMQPRLLKAFRILGAAISASESRADAMAKVVEAAQAWVHSDDGIFGTTLAKLNGAVAAYESMQPVGESGQPRSSVRSGGEDATEDGA